MQLGLVRLDILRRGFRAIIVVQRELWRVKKNKSRQQVLLGFWFFLYTNLNAVFRKGLHVAKRNIFRVGLYCLHINSGTWHSICACSEEGYSEAETVSKQKEVKTYFPKLFKKH